MRPSHREHANPIMLVLLAIPALMMFGAMKGCDTVRATLSEPVTIEKVAPPAVRSTPPREKLKGWLV